jgi:hypothetical protein
MAVGNKLAYSILVNETDWKIIRQVHKLLLKPFKDDQKLLKEDGKYVTLSLLPIAIKAIRAILIDIDGAHGDAEAHNRVKI